MLEKNLRLQNTKEETAWYVLAVAIGLILLFYVWAGYTRYFLAVNNNLRQAAFSWVIANVVLTVLSLVLSFRISPGLLQFNKMEKRSLKIFGLGVLAYPLLLIISIALHRLTLGPLYLAVEFDPVRSTGFLVPPGDTETRLLFFLVRVIGPLWEEIIFRGMIQGALTALLNGNLALVLTSLAFGAIHFQGLAPWISVLMTMGGGFVLGLAYQKSKTLVIPMGLHVFYWICDMSVFIRIL